jgi:hypothetical protein
MATFQDGVDALENSFRNIKHDLSCTARRLDIAFDEEVSSSGGPHPLKLLHRITMLEAEMSTLQSEWEEVNRKKASLLPKVEREI